MNTQFHKIKKYHQNSQQLQTKQSMRIISHETSVLSIQDCTVQS